MKRFLILLIAGHWFLVASANAQVPQLINYQGRLLNGTNLVNGSVELSLRLYNVPTGGASVYEDSNSVTVVDGLYATFIGDQTNSGNFASALTNAEVYVEVAVAGAALAPRERIASVAYALQGANADTLDGLDSTAFSDTGHTHDASAIVSGTLADARLSTNVSLLGSAIDGSEISDGTISNADVTANTFWETDGNAGTTPGTHFLGTTDNTQFEIRVDGLRAVLVQPNSGGPDIVLGAAQNAIASGTRGASILGGSNNTTAVNADNSVIAGGRFNTVGTNAESAAIGGGAGNNIGNDAVRSTIAGGLGNAISGPSFQATIGGGENNKIFGNAQYSFIGGGLANQIESNASHSVIGGGNGGRIGKGSSVSTIAGGDSHNVGTNSSGAFVGGGNDNDIGDNSVRATIAGGNSNDIGTNSNESAIGGGDDNDIGDNSAGATIAGGQLNDIGTNSNDCAIGGGNNNNIGNVSAFATIAGGDSNDIGTNSDHSAIGGGRDNNITNNVSFSVIAGGELNEIRKDSNHATISGGRDNFIGTNSIEAVIAGGDSNIISNSADVAVISGGRDNIIESGSSLSFIGGGLVNKIESESSFAVIVGGNLNGIGTNSRNATIVGGSANRIGSNSPNATISGGVANRIGNDSTNAFAAGRNANANHHGAFVWADDQSGAFASTAPNQFLIRASGGVGIGTNAPQAELHVARGSSDGVVANSSSLLVLENDNNAFISILTGSDDSSGIIFGNTNSSSDGAMFYNTSDARGLEFRTGGNNTRMTIASNGLVGIGTTAPEEKLHVFDGSAGTGVTANASSVAVFENSGNAFVSILTPSNATSGVIFGNNIDETDGSILYVNRNIQLRTAGNSTKMTISSNGLVGIGVTPTGTNILQVAGGAFCSGTTWVNASDKNLKDNFDPVDAHEILAKLGAMPISMWHYKSESADLRHIGPTAQDFHSAFGVGYGDTSISTIDEGGVALAAIQALYEKLQQQQAEIEELKRALRETEGAGSAAPR